jgi:TRAP-type C4-dicarboxylate transport system permease small subunit
MRSMTGLRRMVVVNGRWYLGAGTWLVLFAFFDFVLGWDAYRSNVAAYFPATTLVALSFSMPPRLGERLASSTSLAGVVKNWWPYLVALVSFPILFFAFNLFGWQSHQLVGAAYLAMAILVGCLGSEGHIRTSLLVAMLTSRPSTQKRT